MRTVTLAAGTFDVVEVMDGYGVVGTGLNWYVVGPKGHALLGHGAHAHQRQAEAAAIRAAGFSAAWSKYLNRPVR